MWDSNAYISVQNRENPIIFPLASPLPRLNHPHPFQSAVSNTRGL